MNINQGKKQRARRTLLYGVHGVGKSKWAASAPHVCFLNMEDGLDDIDCASTDLIASHKGLMESLRFFSDQKHDFRYLAIDAVDWLEKVIHKEVAKESGKESIADIGYGAGYKQAMAKWDKVLFALEWLRKEMDMGIILLAHCDIKTFQSPEQESYDRYQPALHPLAAAMLQEWCDEVLFASYRVFTRKEDQGFNKERNIAMGDGERYIRTREAPAMLAKNRLDLPDELPMPKENGFAEYTRYFRSAGNIDGTVVDGSSKQK
ncbi:MAG: ATP-binding protein [Planctomycetaceae bacterium]